MKINKIYPDIYEIEDFISYKEQKNVFNLISFGGENIWNMEEKSNYESSYWQNKNTNPEYLPQGRELFDIFYKRIQSLYQSYVEVTGINIQRYQVNDFLGYHVDNHDGHLKNGWHMRYGIVLYYNDDYSGGELHYKDLKITHKPKARSLIMHGGNILHGTTPVLGGSTRYFSTCFVKGTKEKPVILNKKFFDGIEESDGTEYK